VEEGRNLKITAQIISAGPLRTTSVLYRSMGLKTWKVISLDQINEVDYESVIESDEITPPGIEYCVVAVDQEAKGVGYSGLPARPIQVNVIEGGYGWRIAGGIFSALSWGIASYVILRKQTN
jgi:hypothetical protein